MFCSDYCRSWPRDEKINNHGCWGKHAHISDNDYWGICLFHVVWTIFFGAIILMWYTWNIFLLAMHPTLFSSTEQCAWVIISPKEFKSWVTRISFALLYGGGGNRIICCQIFCALLLKSAFEWIFNVMQLILVKIKWHIKWKYLIQKFHDICLPNYFNIHTCCYFNFVDIAIKIQWNLVLCTCTWKNSWSKRSYLKTCTSGY